MALIGFSALAMSEKQAQREERRSPVVAGDVASAPFIMKVDLDIFRGERITVVWMQPRGDGVEPDQLPVGVGRLPEAGQAVVSPAMSRLAEEHPGLSRRYPHTSMIGDEGLADADELLVYMRPSDARSIGAVSEARRAVAGQVEGAGPHFAVTRPGALDDNLGTRPPHLSWLVLGGLTAPVLLLLYYSAASSRKRTSRRADLLRAIGAPKGFGRMWRAVEIVTVCVPGLALFILGWSLMSERVTYLPVVGVHVVRGDLGLSWITLVLTGSAICVAIVLMCLLVDSVPGADAERRRALPGLHGVMNVLMAGGAFALFSANLLPSLRFQLLLLGASALIATSPIVVHLVVESSGRMLRAAKSPSLHVAGRKLETETWGAIGPVVAIPICLVLGSLLLGYYSVGSVQMGVPASFSPDGPSTTSIAWDDPLDSDVDALRDQLPDHGVYFFSLPSAESPEGDGEDAGQQGSDEPDSSGAEENAASREVLVVHEPCVDFLGDAGMCGSREGEVLIPDPDLLNSLSRAVDQPLRGIRFEDGRGSAAASGVLVLAPDGLLAADENIRDVATTLLPAPEFSRAAFSASPPPQQFLAWIQVTAVLAIVPVILGVLLVGMRRWMDSIVPLAVLHELGADARWFARTVAAIFLVPLTCALVVGAIGGAAVLSALARDVTLVPLQGLVLLAGASLAFGGVALLYVWWSAKRLAS